MLRVCKYIVVFSLLLAVIWLIGLIFFIRSVEKQVDMDDVLLADAIVVLTGGSERVERGLALYQAGKAPKVFISGAGEGVPKQDFLQPNIASNEHVILGYEAKNTYGNAKEVQRWVQENGVQSIILVTSNYHMPRSRYEMEQVLDGVTMQVFPVVSGAVKLDGWWKFEGTRRLLLEEYYKWIAVQMGIHFTKGEVGLE